MFPCFPFVLPFTIPSYFLCYSPSTPFWKILSFWFLLSLYWLLPFPLFMFACFFQTNSPNWLFLYLFCCFCFCFHVLCFCLSVFMLALFLVWFSFFLSCFLLLLVLLCWQWKRTVCPAILVSFSHVGSKVVYLISFMFWFLIVFLVFLFSF